MDCLLNVCVCGLTELSVIMTSINVAIPIGIRNDLYIICAFWNQRKYSDYIQWFQLYIPVCEGTIMRYACTILSPIPLL
jgi:hypothetical protein